MPVTNTDAILWYNVGVFGDAGYAVPNWSNDVGSNNPGIIDVVNLMGQSLFNVMHHEDVDLRVPPSINTLRRIHKLYVRLKQILAGRAVPPSQPNMETMHSRPAGEIWRVYPVPFFKARNQYMRRWCEWIMIAMAEAMQHTENRKELEFSTLFAGQIGQYMSRVYQNMAIEMFGKTPDQVRVEAFELSDVDFNAYDPSKFFTGTEMTDTVPRLDRIFTEDRLELLREGIPVTHLPELQPWPNNLTAFYAGTRSDATMNGNPGGEANVSQAGGPSSVIVMPPAPQP